MRVFKTQSELNAALALPALEPNAFRFAKQFSPAGFVCADCGETKPFPFDGCGTGYARCDDKPNGLICYDCCGKRDMQSMRDTGKAVLYLTCDPNKGRKWFVSNWPGTFKTECHVRKGRHNIARVRYDAWFSFEGKQWHGVQFGDNTQIIRCKQVKG